MGQKIDLNSIPNHVAIIMDGNGRWAQARNLPRSAGHKEGVEVIRKIALAANEIGVKALTLYAFSTENWKRSLAEVKYLMQLPELFFNKFLPELIEHDIKVRVIGFEEKVPPLTQSVIKQAEKRTMHCKGLQLNFAFNYGSRAEIVHAVQEIAKKVSVGTLQVESINEETIRTHLLTAPLMPFDDVDYLIRTSHEERLSNFLLWQNAYSEFYFSDVYWPDFTTEMFFDAIAAYQKRNRRFGGVSDKKEKE
ncbi:isoprenyl transferase [Allofustis seminis]|uniref:isoprenyl transferase n=1 Tax=Allofustis seminis TaxID=166939 RepID=UPI00036C1379|nr:isoprenyl transferase [Allofustis seminis]